MDTQVQAKKKEITQKTIETLNISGAILAVAGTIGTVLCGVARLFIEINKTRGKS